MESIHYLLEPGETIFQEIISGAVLTGLVKQIRNNLKLNKDDHLTGNSIKNSNEDKSSNRHIGGG